MVETTIQDLVQTETSQHKFNPALFFEEMAHQSYTPNIAKTLDKRIRILEKQRDHHVRELKKKLDAIIEYDWKKTMSGSWQDSDFQESLNPSNLDNDSRVKNIQSEISELTSPKHYDDMFMKAVSSYVQQKEKRNHFWQKTRKMWWIPAAALGALAISYGAITYAQHHKPTVPTPVSETTPVRTNKSNDPTVTFLMQDDDYAIVSAKVDTVEINLMHAGPKWSYGCSDDISLKFDNSAKEVSFEDRTASNNDFKMYDGKVDMLKIKDGKVMQNFYRLTDYTTKKEEFDLADRVLAYVLHRYKKEIFWDREPYPRVQPTEAIDFENLFKPFHTEYSVPLDTSITEFWIDTTKKFVLTEATTEYGNIQYRYWGDLKNPGEFSQSLQTHDGLNTIYYDDNVGSDGFVDEMTTYQGNSKEVRNRDGSADFKKGDELLKFFKEKFDKYLPK